MARLIAGLAALLTALCFASGALAHASLVSTEPADGGVVAQAPKTVQLNFNESVTPAVVSLIDAAGNARDVTIRAADQSVVIALPDDLPRGTQIVSYRVVSQDGHPVVGSVVFSIGVVTGGAAPASDHLVSTLIWLARIGVYLGLFVGIGGVFFAAWIGQAQSGAKSSYRLACDRLCQRGGVDWPARSRSAQSSPRRPRDICTMDECACHQPRAVAADGDGGDGDRRVHMAKAKHDDRPGADDAGDGGRWAFTGNERPRRDGITRSGSPCPRFLCTVLPWPFGPARWRR